MKHSHSYGWILIHETRENAPPRSASRPRAAPHVSTPHSTEEPGFSLQLFLASCDSVVDSPHWAIPSSAKKPPPKTLNVA